MWPQKILNVFTTDYIIFIGANEQKCLSVSFGSNTTVTSSGNNL